MKAIRAAELREKMKDILDMVAGGETVVIPRPKNKNVVVISEDEWNALIQARKNTEYLKTLDVSLAEYAAGQTIAKTMDELDALANG